MREPESTLSFCQDWLIGTPSIFKRVGMSRYFELSCPLVSCVNFCIWPNNLLTMRNFSPSKSLASTKPKVKKMSSDRIWEPKQRFPHFVVTFLTHGSASVKTSLDSWLSLLCNYKNFNELLLYWNTIFEASWIIPEPWSLIFSYRINYLILFEVRAFFVVVSLVDFLFCNSRAVLWKVLWKSLYNS